MVNSSSIMAPLSPSPQAPALTKRTTDDLFPKIDADVGTKNATARPNGPTQLPQDTGLQAKANDDTQDSNGLEAKVSPMTSAVTLQIFGMGVL